MRDLDDRKRLKFGLLVLIPLSTIATPIPAAFFRPVDTLELVSRMRPLRSATRRCCSAVVWFAYWTRTSTVSPALGRCFIIAVAPRAWNPARNRTLKAAVARWNQIQSLRMFDFF